MINLNIKNIVQVVVLLIAQFTFLMMPLTPALAAPQTFAQGTPPPVDPNEIAKDAVCQVGGSCPENNSAKDTIVNVVNTLLYIIGIVSVIMVIVGGLRFVLSAGDANSAQSARNTILYAIIGLTVAFAAWGIVNFVVKAFDQNA